MVQRKILRSALKLKKSKHGIIRFVRSRNFPKNLHILPPDTHTYIKLIKSSKANNIKQI